MKYLSALSEKKDDLCLSHPKKLEEMFFDTMLFRRNIHFSEQLFSVWDHTKPVLIQTAVTTHKSQHFLENAILLYSCSSLYVHTEQYLFVRKPSNGITTQ